MNIDLQPRVVRFLETSVKKGDYANASAVVTEALGLLEKRDRLISGDLARSWPGLGASADGDVMALAFIVMMQAAKSAQEDLKSIMAEVKAINAAKSAMRSLLAAVRRDIVENLGRQTLVFADGGLGSAAAYHRIPVPHPDPGSPGGVRTVATNPYTRKLTDVEALKAVYESIKNDLDSMSEMGEMESLRLQMAMDRLSKMMSTLSNMLKKISESNATIIGNIK